MPPILPDLVDDKLVIAGIWPSTKGGDWCGEWETFSLEDVDNPHSKYTHLFNRVPPAGRIHFMVSRLILTLVLVSSVTGCMPEETTSVNQEEQESGQTQNRQNSPDDKAEELYLPGQD